MLKNSVRITMCCLLVCVLATISISAANTHRHIPPADPIVSKHPHTVTYFCDQCDRNITSNVIYANCGSCKMNSSTAKNTAEDTFVFVYLDGDAGMGVPITAAVPCSLTYTNVYQISTSPDEFAPPFYILGINVRASAEPEVFHPDMVCIAPTEVELYQNSNLINTITLAYPGDTSVANCEHLLAHNSTALIFDETLTHSITGDAAFGMSGAFGSYALAAEVEF